MTFGEWSQLTPAEAAYEVHRRADALAPAQRRAVIATLASREELEQRFASASDTSLLSGIPYFLKDLFDVVGEPTFAGSQFLPEVRPTPPRDSAIVRALHDAGAVRAGKTHLHEFAYGITGENAHYGDCEHPRFPGRSTGGSSSGSAAAVAAGLTPFAIATDTGGSVRVPAAFCGLYGFRTIPGDQFIRDAFPLAPTCDTAGWFTATPADMLVAIGELVGLRTSTRAPRGCYLEFGELDPEVKVALRAAVEPFCGPADLATGSELRHGFAACLDTYNVVVAREAWATHRAWAERYRERYDPVVWPRLNRIHTITPAQHSAADLQLAALRILWTKFFLSLDFLVLPATPCPALTKAECTLENRTRLLTLNVPASLGALPVLTIPVTLPSGLSTGLQIIVNHPQSPVIHWALHQTRSVQKS